MFEIKLIFYTIKLSERIMVIVYNCKERGFDSSKAYHLVITTCHCNVRKVQPFLISMEKLDSSYPSSAPPELKQRNFLFFLSRPIGRNYIHSLKHHQQLSPQHYPELWPLSSKKTNWITLFEECPEDFATARCHGKEPFNLHREQRQNMHKSIPHLERALG
jgi:hypothetical protein